MQISSWKLCPKSSSFTHEAQTIQSKIKNLLLTQYAEMSKKDKTRSADTGKEVFQVCVCVWVGGIS